MQDNFQVTITSAISVVLFSAVIAGGLSVVLRKDALLSKIKYEILLICMAIPLVKILIPVEMLPLTYNINVTVILPEIVQFFSLKLATIGTKELTVWSVVLLVLGVGYVINAVRVFWFYMRARKEVEKLKKVDNPLLYELIDRILSEKNKKITVELKWLEPDYSPMTGGILKPYILIPKRDISELEWESILRHELAHYLNGDSVIRFVWVLMTTLCWWNPIVNILNAQFEQLMEIRADANATKNVGKKVEAGYMDALVTLSTEFPEVGNNQFCTMYKGKGISAKRRVMIMLARDGKQTAGYWTVNVSMVLLGIVFAVAMNVFILEPYKPPVEVFETERDVVSTSCFLVKNAGGTYDMYMDGIFCATLESTYGSDMPVYETLEEALQYEENK